MMETETRLTGDLALTCTRDAVVCGLGTVSRAVSTRGSVQVLSGTELRAEADGLHLAATDMELSLRTTVAAEVTGEGAVVVPGRVLTDLARLLPAEQVGSTFAAQDAAVVVRSGSDSSR